MSREKIQFLQELTEKEHLKYFLRILHFDFWSDDERLFFIWMYDKVIIEKMHWDDMIYTKHLDRFFEILNYDSFG